MGQKSRNDLTSVIGSNIFDNNNKEILASMVRVVLNDFRDSKFNLIDDELKGVTYQTIGGNKQTLEQYLNSVVGALPVYGTITNVDPGGAVGVTYTSGGIITSAKSIDRQHNDTLIEVNFSQSIANRRIIPLINYTSEYWGKANDFCVPVIKRISSTRIHLAIREVSGGVQKINFEIIAL